LIEKDKISLILPTIIYEEWRKNKEKKVIAHNLSLVKGIIKNAKQIKDYISGEDSEIFAKIINNINDEMIKEKTSMPAKNVDSLFSHPSTIRIEVTDSSKIKAIDFGLSNKRPFHNNKNSTNDALIIFSSMEYVEDNGIMSDCIFITENTLDFSDDKNKNKPHPDISHFFSDGNAKYFINLGEAINHIEQGLVDDTEVMELQEEIAYKELESSFASAYGLHSEALAAGAINRGFIDSISSSSVLKSIAEQQNSIANLAASDFAGISALKIFEEEQKRIRDSYGLSSSALASEALNRSFIDSIASSDVLKSIAEQQNSIANLATSDFAGISVLKIFEEEQKRIRDSYGLSSSALASEALNRDFLDSITGNSVLKSIAEQQNSIANLAASDFAGNSALRVLAEEQKRIRDSYKLPSVVQDVLRIIDDPVIRQAFECHKLYGQSVRHNAVPENNNSNIPEKLVITELLEQGTSEENKLVFQKLKTTDDQILIIWREFNDIEILKAIQKQILPFTLVCGNIESSDSSDADLSISISTDFDIQD